MQSTGGKETRSRGRGSLVRLFGVLYLRVGFLVGLDAGGALRREESTAAVLTAAVSGFFLAHGAAHAVQDTRNQQAGHCGPHEGEGLDAQTGSLVVGVELVAALDVHGADRSVS